MSNIRCLKLISGELAVTQLTEEEGEYILKKAVVLMGTPDGIGMMPLSPFGKEDDLRISKSHVLFVDEVDDEVKNIYNAKFGSGIVMASGFSVVNPK